MARIREPGAPGDLSDDSLRFRLQDARLYPVARPKRVLGVTTAVDPTLAALLAAGQPPRGRVFSFALNCALSSRSTVSFGPLTAAVLVRGIHVEFDSHSDPVVNSLEIGWAQTPVTEQSVALGTPRPYTVLTERNVNAASFDPNMGQGLINWTTPNTIVNWQKQLHLIITANQPYLCLSLVQGSAISTLRCTGEVTLLEAVSLPALDTFTG
jgi:hypothetical protein